MFEAVNIVCAYKVADPTNPTSGFEVEDLPDNQRGTWNKNVVTWWVNGYEKDEFFEKRYSFLRRLLNTAFTEWDIEIPIVFIQAESEEVADIIIEFGPRSEDKYYPDNTTVLAYAGFPDGPLKGYIKAFTDWDWNAHGRTGINFLIVMIHELGHTLGRPHSKRGLFKDMMDAFYNKNILDLSSYDIALALKAYGAREYDNPEQHERLEKAHSRSKIRLQKLEIQKHKS